MTMKQKMTGRAMTLPVGALLGAVYAFAWTLIASGVLAWLVHSEKLAEDAIGYGSIIILLSASLTGALVAYGKVKRQRAAVSAAAAGIYYIMLLVLTALFFGGQYRGMGVTALLILAGTGTAILLGMRQGRSSGRNTHKIKR